jgi:hypothetical protein
VVDDDMEYEDLFEVWAVPADTCDPEDFTDCELETAVLLHLKNVIFKTLELVTEKVRERICRLYVGYTGWLSAEQADNSPELFAQQLPQSVTQDI